MEPTEAERQKRAAFLAARQRQKQQAAAQPSSRRLLGLSRPVLLAGAAGGLVVAAWLTIFGVQDTMLRSSDDAQAKFRGIQFGSRGRTAV